MKQFHIGDILTVTTGKTVCDRSIDGVNDLLNFLTNDVIYTHQLRRVGLQCKPYLLQQFPQLKDITGEDVTEHNWREWMEDKISKFGMHLEVIPLPESVHKEVDPFVEMMEIQNGKQVTISELYTMNIELDKLNNIQQFKPWSQERRESVLHSIFHGKKIGKIIVSDKRLFDGRQILLTIYDFMNDKYTFQGKLFSEWGIEQQIIFKAYKVDLIEVPKLEDSTSLIYTQINKHK
jgi:hypothetical protein